MRPFLALLLFLLASAGAQGGARVEVCFNYSCATSARVDYDFADLDALRMELTSARDPASERAAIATAVGTLYRIAGRQTPISADRGGNFSDGGVHGRMDCIDHSTTTTRLLELMESREWLRFHKVLEPVRRNRVIFQHFSAAIEEVVTRAPPMAEVHPEHVPDHVPLLLVLCDCEGVTDESSRPDDSDVELEAAPGSRFVVDSWFVDHGEPAVVLPLVDWLKGEGPNVQ